VLFLLRSLLSWAASAAAAVVREAAQEACLVTAEEAVVADQGAVFFGFLQTQSIELQAAQAPKFHVTEDLAAQVLLVKVAELQVEAAEEVAVAADGLSSCMQH
jgi:hypothetical protein